MVLHKIACKLRNQLHKLIGRPGVQLALNHIAENVVSEPKWPVIVERLDPNTATAIYCDKCGWEGQQDDPSEGYIGDVGSCPKCAEWGTLDYCYEEGDKCACGRLAIELPVKDEHGRYCSRAHQLQAEYARELSDAA
jgi:hypothetical protein